MTRRVEDAITECGTNAPRKVCPSRGHCIQCPDWRGPQDLINGLCFDHRVFAMPPHKRKKCHNG